MDVTGLNRQLPTQGGQRNRELAAQMLRGTTLKQDFQEAAVEQLATVPEAWLDRLADENMAYVGLSYGQSLADTELLRGYTPERLRSDAELAKPMIAEVQAEVDAEIAQLLQEAPDSTEAAFAEYRRPETVAERLGAKFQEENIGFEVRVQRGPLPLEHLQNEFAIADDPCHEYMYPDGSNEEARETKIFGSLLAELNGAGAIADAMVDPESDVVIVPYKMRGDKRISPVSEESYASINGQQLDQHHGMNIWPNRLIVVDDEVVAMPNRKMGYHSVLLHETGHAIDYAAESVPELNHRQTIDALYQRDMQRATQGDDVFLTARAKDNVREYFAEAVEAYLTRELPASPANFYKKENNAEQLQASNPELFAYLEKLMAWQNTGTVEG